MFRPKNEHRTTLTTHNQRPPKRTPNVATLGCNTLFSISGSSLRCDDQRGIKQIMIVAPRGGGVALSALRGFAHHRRINLPAILASLRYPSIRQQYRGIAYRAGFLVKAGPSIYCGTRRRPNISQQDKVRN